MQHWIQRVVMMTVPAALALNSRGVRAQNGPASEHPLAFAGTAFLGAAADVDALFPLVRRLERLAAQDGHSLSQVLLTALKRSGISVDAGLAPRLGRSVAFAYESESRSSEKIDRFWRITTTISGQLLVVDFSRQQVVSAFPSTFEYVDARARPVDAEYDAVVADAMLTTLLDSTSAGFFVRTASAFQHIGIASADRCRIRIGEVKPDSEFASQTASRFHGNEAEQRVALTEIAMRSWITASGMAMLPASRTQAVDGRMAGRFSDGSVFSLKVPEPDYVMHLDPVRSRRKTIAANGIKRIDATAVLVGLHIVEPLTNTHAASGEFRTTVLDTLPASQRSVDPWPAIVNALKSLMGGIAVASKQADRVWFAAHGSQGQPSDALTSMSSWYARCQPMSP